MKTYRWIVATILIALIGLPITTVSAFSTISLTSSKPNPAMIGGEITFDFAVSVDKINPGVSGIEIYLSYDPSLVTPPTTPGSTAAEVLPDFFGVSNFSINEVLPAAQCPEAAKPCIHLVLAGPPQSSQTGIAARFHFRALATGTATFGIVKAVLVDANGFNVPIDQPSSQSTISQLIQNRATTGTVLRQGVPAGTNNGGGTLACSNVTAGGTWNYGPVLTVAPTGKFNFADVPTGTYTLRAKYPGYLDSQKTGVAIPDNSLTVDVATTTLRGGDVDGNNAINILDIGVIISKFGKTGVAVRSATPAACGTDEPADINDDGAINISDLAIAAGNWGATGPTPWLP